MERNVIFDRINFSKVFHPILHNFSYFNKFFFLYLKALTLFKKEHTFYYISILFKSAYNKNKIWVLMPDWMPYKIIMVNEVIKKNIIVHWRDRARNISREKWENNDFWNIWWFQKHCLECWFDIGSKIWDSIFNNIV